MNNINPLVSIIIPTYNRENTICRAVESVMKQTYKNWELIIVDDGSIDNTGKKLSLYKEDDRIKYFKIENGGVSHARNFGINKSSGEFLAFLDSDDELSEKKIEIQLYKMISNSSHASVSNLYKVFESGKSKIYSKIKSDFFINKKDIINNTIPVSGSCIMVKRSLKVFFDEKMFASEDADFILQTFKTTNPIFIAEALVFNYRSLNGNRLSTSIEKLTSGLKYRVFKLNNNAYNLDKKERNLYLTKTNLLLGLVFLSVLDCKSARKYFVAGFRNNGLYLKYRILYVISFFPKFINFILSLYKKIYY